MPACIHWPAQYPGHYLHMSVPRHMSYLSVFSLDRIQISPDFQSAIASAGTLPPKRTLQHPSLPPSQSGPNIALPASYLLHLRTHAHRPPQQLSRCWRLAPDKHISTCCPGPRDPQGTGAKRPGHGSGLDCCTMSKDAQLPAQGDYRRQVSASLPSRGGEECK